MLKTVKILFAVIAAILLININSVQAAPTKKKAPAKPPAKVAKPAPAPSPKPSQTSPAAPSEPQIAPSGITPEKAKDTKNFLSKERGKITFKFLYPKPGQQCGNAGLYRITVPSPIDKTGVVDIFLARDQMDIRTEPSKVLATDVLRGQNDELIITVFGLITGVEQKIAVLAYSEKDNPGENPLYNESIKLKLEPDTLVTLSIPATFDSPPKVVESEKPKPETPATATATVTVPVNVAIRNSIPMPVEISKDDAPFAAMAGPDIEVLRNQPVTLKGNPVSGTQAAIRYTWRQISGEKVVLTGWDTPIATFTASIPGRYVFEYEIYDGTNSSMDSVNVNVLGKIGFFMKPQEISRSYIGVSTSKYYLTGSTLVMPNDTEPGEGNLMRNLLFMDVSDMTKPSAKANYKIDYLNANTFRTMTSDGSFLYMVYETDKATFVLLIANISNPDNPRIVGSLPLSAGNPRFITAKAGKLYVAIQVYKTCWIDTIDVTRPGKPVLQAHSIFDETWGGSMVGAFAGDTLLVIASKIGFYNMSAPDKPVETASFPVSILGLVDPVVIGNNIFTIVTPNADSADVMGNKMVVFRGYDVSDPAQPKQSAEYIGETGMQSAAAANGSYIYLVHQLKENKGKYYLDIYDVSNLKDIKMLSRYETDKQITDLQVRGDYVIIVEGGQLVVLRVSG